MIDVKYLMAAQQVMTSLSINQLMRIGLLNDNPT